MRLTRDEFDALVSEGATSEEVEAIRFERQQVLEDVKALCSTPEGIRFFKWLMKRTRLVDDIAHDRDAGARAIGCEIFELIREASPVTMGAVLTKE